MRRNKPQACAFLAERAQLHICWLKLEQVCVCTLSLEPDLVSVYVQENLTMSSLHFPLSLEQSFISQKSELLWDFGGSFFRVQLAHPFTLCLEMQLC